MNKGLLYMTHLSAFFDDENCEVHIIKTGADDFEANAMRDGEFAQTSWSGHGTMLGALNELDARLGSHGEDMNG